VAVAGLYLEGHHGDRKWLQDRVSRRRK